MEDTQDCTEMFFRMDKARLRQGILDCDATSCDCVDDTQEVRSWGDCGINLHCSTKGYRGGSRSMLPTCPTIGDFHGILDNRAQRDPLSSPCLDDTGDSGQPSIPQVDATVRTERTNFHPVARSFREHQGGWS